MRNIASTFHRSSLVLAALAGIGGCAATIDQAGIEQKTSSAIGRPTGSFTISNQVEGTGGRIDYSVKARDGASYKCYMYSATGFQRAMSFGQTPHSEAICTAAGGGATTPAPAACNALNKAAGRC
ncbi:hypothetical protein [uncultured Methylibium sp.]|uniref:hypothetical protein n=1 Tax=uncultured Methylibium sp. TaxID=381093 RepID=UPI0025EE7A7F|nr:hypothetical protein [uncultured Methylibium sp.]